MPIAEINHQGLYFEDSGGTGPALILAHGFLMDGRMFDPQVQALAPEFRVIRWDGKPFNQVKLRPRPRSGARPQPDASRGRQSASGGVPAHPRVSTQRERKPLGWHFPQPGPLAEDALGRLSLTHAGMREHDRLVLEAAWHRGLPLVLTLGGGYAKPITATLLRSRVG